MVIVAIEASPVGSKPPAAVGERISKNGRQNLGAAAPLSTRAFYPEQGGAGGPVQSSPKLVEHIGSGSTRSAEQLSPCIACTTVAAPSVRSRAWCLRARLPPWQDVAAERQALGVSNADPYFSNLLSSPPTYSPVNRAGSSYCTCPCPIDRIVL